MQLCFYSGLVMSSVNAATTSAMSADEVATVFDADMAGAEISIASGTEPADIVTTAEARHTGTYTASADQNNTAAAAAAAAGGGATDMCTRHRPRCWPGYTA